MPIARAIGAADALERDALSVAAGAHSGA